jgi:hypothetical protein
VLSTGYPQGIVLESWRARELKFSGTTASCLFSIAT